MMRTGSAVDAPVLYGWKRSGDRGYRKVVEGRTYHVFGFELPDDCGSGKAGDVVWQVEIDGVWPGTDPFPFKRSAVDYVSDGVHAGWWADGVDP